MRILHVTHQFPPNHIGGTEIYTHTLASHLRDLGHQSIVFTPETGPRGQFREDSWGGVPVFRALTGRSSPQATFKATFGDPFLQRALARALSTADPDLIHVHHLMGLPAAICKQIKELGLPVVATLHDYWLLCPNAQLLTNYDQSVCPGPRLWLNCARCAAARLEQPALNVFAPVIAGVMAWRAHILRKAIEAIQIFVAPTAFVRDLFVQKGVIPADRVIHIPHGVGTEMVRPRPPGPADGPLRVAYLGGISWQKGVHVLVDAMSLLQPSLVTLRIYGDLTAFPRYGQRLTDQAASQPNTSFAGHLTRAEVWDALAVTDVLVVPSLWYETAALVIQEAFAAGAPVIASRLGALQERVRHGIDGLLLPAGDSRTLANALARLAADRNYFLGLQANIQPVVTISQHVKRVLSLYERLVIAAGRRYNSACERSIASTSSPH